MEDPDTNGFIWGNSLRTENPIARIIFCIAVLVLYLYPTNKKMHKTIKLSVKNEKVAVKYFMIFFDKKSDNRKS
jgi:hypothetical protein